MIAVRDFAARDLASCLGAFRLSDNRAAFIHLRPWGAAVVSVREMAALDRIVYEYGYPSSHAALDAVLDWNPLVHPEPEGWTWAREKGDEGVTAQSATGSPC